MRAIIFGSIGTLVETSDLQRRAFNAAFAEAGLAWVWDEAPYRAMLAAFDRPAALFAALFAALAGAQAARIEGTAGISTSSA